MMQYAGRSEKQNMQEKDINALLDAIEQPSFLLPTFIASGHNTVSSIILDTSEVKGLIAYKDISLPLIRHRYQQNKLQLSEEAKLVYFIILGYLHDTEMLHDIVAYLRGCKTLPASTLLSPWHPFLYAVDALAEITGGQIQPPSHTKVMEELDTFLKRGRKMEAIKSNRELEYMNTQFFIAKKVALLPSLTPTRRSLLQRVAVNASPTNGMPPIVHDVLRSPGQSLDRGTRAFMEPRFNHDFSGVRVHTDARAAESAQSVNALAYTVGHDVVFGAGQYTPTTMTRKGFQKASCGLPVPLKSAKIWS